MNKALLVGINEYAAQPRLAGCIGDVVDLEAFLASRHVVDPSEIVVLVDEHATKRAIVDALAELVAGLEHGDCGYVHFSGHGARMASADEPDGMDEVLCPHDFAWTADTALADHELLAILDTLDPGASLMLTIDACHAGDFLRGFGMRGRPRTLMPPEGMRRRGPTVRGFRAAAHAPNVTFVAACSPWQIAADAAFDGRPRGAFSYQFLVALRANGATQTVEEMVAALAQPLREHAMTPVAENAHRCYLAVSEARTPSAFASPFRSASAFVGAIVYEQQWQSTLVGRAVETGVRIGMLSGALTAHVVVRGLGSTLSSPPISLVGDGTFPIMLGFFGAHASLTVSSWSVGPGTIDFVLQLELASNLAFEPRVDVARVPVHVDVGRRPRASTSPIGSPTTGSPSGSLTGSPTTGSPTTGSPSGSPGASQRSSPITSPADVFAVFAVLGDAPR